MTHKNSKNDHIPLLTFLFVKQMLHSYLNYTRYTEYDNKLLLKQHYTPIFNIQSRLQPQQHIATIASTTQQSTNTQWPPLTYQPDICPQNINNPHHLHIFQSLSGRLCILGLPRWTSFGLVSPRGHIILPGMTFTVR